MMIRKNCMEAIIACDGRRALSLLAKPDALVPILYILPSIAVIL
jgi:hypothetical protein